MKTCMKQHVWDAVQFLFKDGIDGQETVACAESLGLSTNGGLSKLWEIQTVNGWKIVNHGDWILSQPFGTGKIYTVVKKELFERDMVLF